MPRRRRRSPRRSGRWPCAARRRSASRPRTGSRSPRCAATTSPRPSACSRRRGRPRSTSPGRSTRCAPTRPPERARALHARRGRALPRAWPRTPPSSSRPGTRALTHCNAGGLATGGYGSAVGALRAAWERGLLEHVLVDETRPLLQGARLTAWELETAGIPHAVIADSAAASMMARGEVDADRHRRRPHRRERRHREQDRHVLARRARARTTASRSTSSRRRSTVDLATRDRRRDPDRGARPGRGDRRGSPRATRPSTSRPPALIAAIVTEHGVHRAPYADRSRRRCAHEGAHPRRRLRDAAPPADRHDREAAAAGRRPADGRLDRSTGSARSTRSTRCTSSRTRKFAAALRRAGRRAARRRSSTTTARRRTTTGSARSATSRFVIERAGIDDDLLVIAGDNLFDFSLADFVALLARRRATASAVARLRRRRPRARDAVRRRRRSTTTTGVVGFVEKPARAAVDARRDRDVPLPPRARAARRALPRRGQPARPARPPRRLARTRASPSTATGSRASWYDIGDAEQLLEADNRLRARAGLPFRDSYSLD